MQIDTRMVLEKKITADTVQAIVEFVKAELITNAENPQVCEALRRVGGCALRKFRWDPPSWAIPYYLLFSEAQWKAAKPARSDTLSERLFRRFGHEVAQGFEKECESLLVEVAARQNTLESLESSVRIRPEDRFRTAAAVLLLVCGLLCKADNGTLTITAEGHNIYERMKKS